MGKFTSASHSLRFAPHLLGNRETGSGYPLVVLVILPVMLPTAQKCTCTSSETLWKRFLGQDSS